MAVKFTLSREQLKLAQRIADRFRAMQKAAGVPMTDRRDLVMDLDAAHSNGCALDLKRLAEADDFNLAHDVGGIARHINRNTGRLGGCFLPRFAARH